MILIGETLNSSVPSTGKALKTGDEKTLVSLIRAQADAGADYLDINTAMCGSAEAEWMTRIIKWTVENTDCGVMPDSPDPAVLQEAAKAAQGRKLIFNSVTPTDRFDEIAPLAAEMRAGVVALPIGRGMPRVETARSLAERLKKAGVAPENIYIDALVESIATDDESGLRTLKTVSEIKRLCPSVHVLCGLSNASFGLPGRVSVNAAFLTLAAREGLDAAILDVRSEALMTALRAAEAVLGLDEYCMEYIRHMRRIDRAKK